MAVEVKTYEKNPPRIEVIKVTRNNYNEVAEHIGIKRVAVKQEEFDLVQTVTLIPATGESLEFKIPVDFATPYESYIYREITQKDSTWAVIRQYDLGFGYSEVVVPTKETKSNKENN